LQSVRSLGVSMPAEHCATTSVNSHCLERWRVRPSNTSRLLNTGNASHSGHWTWSQTQWRPELALDCCQRRIQITKVTVSKSIQKTNTGAAISASVVGTMQTSDISPSASQQYSKQRLGQRRQTCIQCLSPVGLRLTNAPHGIRPGRIVAIAPNNVDVELLDLITQGSHIQFIG